MAIKPFSRQNFAARNFNVINTTPVATYSLSSLAASYNEGDTITITITTGFIVDGTVLYWTTSGTSTGADFSDGVTSGSVTITNNTGTVTRTLLSDLTTEGTETFVFELRTGSTSGTIVATSSSANVLDTSISPINYSVLFNGSTQNLSVASATALTLTADFTVECFAYATTTTNAVDQVFNYGNFTFMLYHNGTTWTVEIGNGTSNYFTLSGTASLNAWHHFAITRSSNTYTFWIDGISASTTTNANAPLTNGTLYIGSNPATTQRFTGYISNFRIVKGTAVYTAAFSPPASTLTAITNTSLLTCRNSTISDSSSNAFTITNTGTTLVSGENPFGNYSMSFNGSSQYLTVAANAAHAFGTGNFTIEFWIYNNSLPSPASRPFSQGGSNVNGEHLFIIYANGSSDFAPAGTPAITTTAAGTFVTGTWQHVAICRSGSTVTCYVNGVSKSSGTSSYNHSATTAIYIGGNPGTSSQYTNGYISNLRVVNGTAVYTAAFSPPTAPLTAIANTSLLTCQYPVIYDNSTNKLAITNTGSTPAITTNPFDNYAYAFNGSSQYLSLAGNAAFNFGTSDFTIECWAYFNDLSDYRTLLANYTSPSSGGGNWLFQHIITTNKMGFYYDSSSVITGTTTLTTGTWYHFAMVRSGTTVTAYVNGISQGTATFSGTVGSSTASLNIGAPQNISTARMNGYISNVRVVKGTAVYTSAFTVPTSPLSAISGTSLLTAQYAELFDASTNNFAVTPTGSPPAVATNLFASPNNLKNYSGKFNGGTTQYLNITNAALAPGTGDFTIECWAFYNGTADNNGIFHLTSSIFPGAVSGLAAAFGASGQFYVYFGGSSNTTTGSYTKNTWLHIALVRASGVTKFYVNGTGITISASDATNYSGGALVIGGYYNTTYLMAGYISNFRIVKGTAVYTANFTPSATPLLPVSGTSLLTLQSNRIYDSGPNQFTITNNGTTTMSYISPFST